MKRKTGMPLAWIAWVAFAIAASGALAQSNISPTEQYAWGENVGWCNFYADGGNGVVVAANHLRGYAWMENAGWLSLGAGPSNGIAYTQTAGDTGVNNDGAGNLSGYAWGENIGWVVFDPAGSGQQVSIGSDGQFHGYAWGENIGWLSLDSGQGVKSTIAFPPAGVADWRLME